MKTEQNGTLKVLKDGKEKVVIRIRCINTVLVEKQSREGSSNKFSQSQ